jgi:hypothetical protein
MIVASAISRWILIGAIACSHLWCCCLLHVTAEVADVDHEPAHASGCCAAQPSSAPGHGPVQPADSDGCGCVAMRDVLDRPAPPDLAPVLDGAAGVAPAPPMTTNIISPAAPTLRRRQALACSPPGAARLPLLCQFLL